MLKGLEAGAINLFINLNKKNAREAAIKVVGGIDASLDARYGAQRSESIQASMCAVVKLFSDTIISELQKDWTPEMKKRHTDVLPDLPVEALTAPKPEPKPVTKKGGKGDKKK